MIKLAAGVLLLFLVSASPEIRYFHYERTFQSLPLRSEQTCAAIDPGVFAHAAPQLADLRLFHEDAETPFILRVATPAENAAEGAERNIVPLNLGARGGQTVFDAELPDLHYSDVLLGVTAQNFIATVTVTGSRAQGDAETSLGAYTIFDLTRQKLGRSTVLHLPESNFGYLHFRIAGPLTARDIAGLSVERLPASQPRYTTLAESAQVTLRDHASVIEFTVPPHVPVDRVVFEPGGTPDLFSRDVTIRVAAVAEARGTETPRPAVTSYGNLLRVHSVQGGHRIDEEHLAVDAPAADFDAPAKWTVTIDNADDAPLEIERVRLQMLERDICFQSTPNVRYKLFYGDPALSAPRYDYAALFTPLPDPAQMTTGPEERNSIYEPRPDGRPFTEKHPMLLWVALVAVVALLAGIALRSTKPVAQKPD